MSILPWGSLRQDGSINLGRILTFFSSFFFQTLGLERLLLYEAIKYIFYVWGIRNETTHTVFVDGYQAWWSLFHRGPQVLQTSFVADRWGGGDAAKNASQGTTIGYIQKLMAGLTNPAVRQENSLDFEDVEKIVHIDCSQEVCAVV